jgi:hypothetical protein
MVEVGRVAALSDRFVAATHSIDCSLNEDGSLRVVAAKSRLVSLVSIEPEELGEAPEVLRR